MAKKEKKAEILGNAEIETFDQSYFEFASKDRDAKIHDEAFKTKPTTFAKDALKRFARNKSSVVGAVIIAILLLGSFIIPSITGHDIDTPHADLSVLPPKLFESGTGWWDGTTKMENIAWDNSITNEDGTHGAPAETNVNAIVPGTMHVDDVTYIDQYFSYAVGGYIRPTSDQGPDPDKIYFFRNFTQFTFAKSDDLVLNYTLGDEDGVYDDSISPYRIRLISGSNDYIAKEWSSDYGEQSINLSSFLESEGLESLAKAKLSIDFKHDSDHDHSYVLIKQVELKSNGNDEELADLLEKISIEDANYTAGLSKQSKASDNLEYWESNAVKNVYHAERRTVSFRYDKYEDVLGHRKGFVVGESIFKEYIGKGWCEFTDFTDISTFRVLDEEKCPVVSVYSGFHNEEYNVWQFETDTIYYKYLGYSKMPKYILGTTANGYDLLTLGMSCLKTSLLIAIISSAVCLTIGLIWGSISGYFGGTVDLVMERITDIISGIPWIVMMTLIILLLGNNAVTFAIALILTGWIGTSSTTRTQFYRFKGREYVLASRTLGASDARLIFKHILPNGLGTIVTSSVLMIPSCIFSEATISYLGLGLKGIHSFGVLLSDNQKYLSTYPVLVLFPAIIISLLMISFNLFGNGLRDALNPTLKGGEQ